VWISNFIWGRYYIEIVRDALLQGGGWPAVWFKFLIVGRCAIFYGLVGGHEKDAGESLNHEKVFEILCSIIAFVQLIQKEFNQIRRRRRLAIL